MLSCTRYGDPTIVLEVISHCYASHMFMAQHCQSPEYFRGPKPSQEMTLPSEMALYRHVLPHKEHFFAHNMTSTQH
jgi:hypothetical protein